MSRTEEIRPDIEDGIDRKVLTQLRARFLKLNQGRLQRAMQALSTRQQLVLKLLPLLFHVNHPLLPGYVSGLTPAGLSGFEPDDELLSEAQRLTRSFAYKPYRGKQTLPIHGLFLMGSLGTVAQAEQSDMDLWVCHAPGLPEQLLGELRRKCQLLEAWAASLGADTLRGGAGADAACQHCVHAFPEEVLCSLGRRLVLRECRDGHPEDCQQGENGWGGAAHGVAVSGSKHPP